MGQYKEYGYKDGNAVEAHGYLLPGIRKMLELCQASVILDVGCGNGYIGRTLQGQKFDVYGIDASDEGITIASKLSPGRFFRHDVTQHNLPPGLDNRVFDTLISAEVIEHLYDPRDFIAFCRDILVDRNGGGNLILTTPYHGYLKNVSIALLDHYDKHHTALWDGGHIKFWSRNTLSALLQEAGFTVHKFAGVGRLPFLWKSMILWAKV